MGEEGGDREKVEKERREVRKAIEREGDSWRGISAREKLNSYTS